MPKLPGLIERNAPSDTYPLLDDSTVAGALKIVADLTARDALPAEVRKEGMPCIVLDSDGAGTRAVYHLSGGIDDANWTDGWPDVPVPTTPNIQDVMNAGSSMTSNASVMRLRAIKAFFGANNTHGDEGDFTSAFVAGFNNAIQAGAATPIVFGVGNTVDGNNTLMFGNGNTANDPFNVNADMIVFGENNTISGNSSKVIGEANDVSATGVTVIGSNLTVGGTFEGVPLNSGSIVLGNFNGGAVIKNGWIIPSKNGATTTASRNLNVNDFLRQDVRVGANTVTITLPAITPPDGSSCQINLMNAAGSITLDASGVTLIDSEAVAITSKAAIDIKSAVLIYDATEAAFKIIGKYTV